MFFGFCFFIYEFLPTGIFNDKLLLLNIFFSFFDDFLLLSSIRRYSRPAARVLDHNKDEHNEEDHGKDNSNKDNHNKDDHNIDDQVKDNHDIDNQNKDNHDKDHHNKYNHNNDNNNWVQENHSNFEIMMQLQIRQDLECPKAADWNFQWKIAIA